MGPMKSIYCCMDWLGRIIVKPSVVLQLTLQACILNHREGGGQDHQDHVHRHFA